MAKIVDSKSETKKLQKEIIALRKQLKVAEKRSISTEKNWRKQQVSTHKELEKKLVSVYQAGYTEAQAEAEQKEAARKKALQTAETSFEKEYRKSGKKTVKGPKARKAKAVKGGRRGVATKKTAKVTRAPKAAAKTKRAAKTATRSPMKKRGRPAKSKQEKHIEGFPRHYETSSSEAGAHESEMI
jgi:hypothetical protein